MWRREDAARAQPHALRCACARIWYCSLLQGVRSGTVGGAAGLTSIRRLGRRPVVPHLHESPSCLHMDVSAAAVEAVAWNLNHINLLPSSSPSHGILSEPEPLPIDQHGLWGVLARPSPGRRAAAGRADITA